MNYSFFCRHCGDYFASNNKEEVKEYRKHHRVISQMQFTGQIIGPFCNLAPITIDKKHAGFARPALAVIIEKNAV